MNYLQFDFEPHNKDEKEKLIALLSEQDFDGFIEEGNILEAFIPEHKFNQEDFEKILERFSILAYTKATVENINWNQKWEEDFKPVLVDKFAGIRAHFHKPLKNVQHEIIITPKMSFGTGHHATTFMMISLMKDVDFKNKKVLDFGTGTGVLAILAEKMGATFIKAIDNDDWSITNTLENILENKCSNIKVEKETKIEAGEKYNIILANINLNVILDNMEALASSINTNGKILLSGFLKDDEPVILKAAANQGLRKRSVEKKKEWIAILCEK